MTVFRTFIYTKTVKGEVVTVQNCVAIRFLRFDASTKFRSTFTPTWFIRTTHTLTVPNLYPSPAKVPYFHTCGAGYGDDWQTEIIMWERCTCAECGLMHYTTTLSCNDSPLRTVPVPLAVCERVSGQYPPGQYPPGQYPPRTKSPRTISPRSNIPPDNIFFF